MKKILPLVLVLMLLGCELLEDSIDTGLTDSEIVSGLKEALNAGVDTSVVSASAAGGYLKNEVIKILLPDEVKTLQNTIETGSFELNVAGYDLNIEYRQIYATYRAFNPNVPEDLFDSLIIAMNQGAESAATKAGPIFGSAITGMSVQDGLAILQGGDTAATHYFEQTTRTNLIDAFSPEVENALNQTKANTLYEQVAGFVNYSYEVKDPIFGTTLQTIAVRDYLNEGKDIPPTLTEYATNKAADGLFHLIGEEEKKIRADPFKWASDIIRKVFGSEEAQG